MFIILHVYGYLFECITKKAKRQWNLHTAKIREPSIQQTHSCKCFIKATMEHIFYESTYPPLSKAPKPLPFCMHQGCQVFQTPERGGLTAPPPRGRSRSKKIRLKVEGIFHNKSVIRPDQNKAGGGSGHPPRVWERDRSWGGGQEIVGYFLGDAQLNQNMPDIPQNQYFI